MSQSSIASILNISRSNYSQIELGNQYPTYDSLSIIARYFSKSYSWLLHGDEAPQAGGLEDFQASASTQVPLVRAYEGINYIKRSHSTSYIARLPLYEIPVTLINKQATYRAFEADTNNTMKTVTSGEIAVGKQVHNYDMISTNEAYIIITSEKIIFCVAKSILPERKELVFCNDYTASREYRLTFDSVKEVWQAICKFRPTIQPAIKKLESSIECLDKLIETLEGEVSKLNTKSKS